MGTKGIAKNGFRRYPLYLANGHTSIKMFHSVSPSA